MKKRILIALVVVLALAATVSLVWATSRSVTQVSDTNTKVYYAELDGSSYPVTPATGLPSGWNSDPDFDDSGWGDAAFYKHSAYFDPTTTSPFDVTGAKWISINDSGAGPDFSTSTGPRGVYLYRKTFGPVPGVAYNISGQAGIGADNYGWLYLNGNLVLEPADKTQNDRNFCVDPCPVGGFGPGPSTGAIPASAVVCDMNVLAAEVQNGISIGTNGPTGVVFSLELNYEVPDVVWQPPVTNADFALKDGTTLPLKFKLYMQDGTLITDMQDVYMTVSGTGLDGLSWPLGDGIDSLRWNDDEYYYIANFQTRNYTLTEGGTYTAVVHDGCTGEDLGSIEFVLNAKAGRGNSGK